MAVEKEVAVVAERTPAALLHETDRTAPRPIKCRRFENGKTRPAYTVPLVHFTITDGATGGRKEGENHT